MTEKEKVIFEIQQILRNLSRSVSGEPVIIPDGIYSEETADEVRNFQRSRNLNVTGKVDYLTFEELKKENDRVLSEATLPLQVMKIKNEDLPLSYGDENKFVEKLKIMLNSVADKHGNFQSLTRDGFFDEETEDAVRRWQSVIFTEVTGEADKETWNSLASYYLL